MSAGWSKNWHLWVPCLEQAWYGPAARSFEGGKFGVQSTPTFFINGKIYRGALTMAEMEKEIAPYLKG